MRLSFRWFLIFMICGTACVPEDLAVPAEPIGKTPTWGEGFTAKAQAQERESLLTMQNVRGGAKDFQPAQNAQSGAQLFQKHCAQCHGAQGHGGQRMGLGVIPPINTDKVKTLTDAQLQHIIINGKGRMPPMKRTVTNKEIAPIIRYLKQLRSGAQ